MSRVGGVSHISVREYVARLREEEPGYSEEELLSLDWRGQDLQGLDLRGLESHGLDLTGANLSEADLCEVYLSEANLSGACVGEANLSGANLSGADLRDAALWDADLSEADLTGANLSGADLRGANLRGAKLLRANLREADLTGADLREADLTGANLSGAELNNADLWRANLSGADLSRADLSGADLSDTILYWDQIPLVPNIDAAVLKAIAAGGNLNMSEWHTCDTTHCRAGWAVVLAGDAGRKLEEELGTNAAAALIYTKSGSHPVPNWYADDRTALEDMKSRAEQQLAASQPLSLEEERIEIG